MFSFGRRIPVTIHPIFWIIALLIGWFNSMSIVGAIVWAVVIFISVLFHEYGHAWTAVAFGQTPRIDLLGFGGLTTRSGPKLKLWKEFLIVLNGPCAGLLLFAIAYSIKSWMGLKGSGILPFGFKIATYVNLVWTLLNLLPILPLDGGRLMSIMLEGMLGLKGVRLSYLFSIVIAGALSILLFVNQVFLGGALFMLLAFESYRSWQATSTMSIEDHNVDLQNMLKKAENRLQNGNKQEAKDLLDEIREQTKSGVIYVVATERLAEMSYDNGHYKETYELLSPIQNKISMPTLKFLHQAAYKIGEWKEAIALGDKVFQSYPTYETALLNALCYALIGEDRPAVGWLQCSVREGLPNLKEILQRREFDHIRDKLSFQNFLKTLS